MGFQGSREDSALEPWNPAPETQIPALEPQNPTPEPQNQGDGWMDGWMDEQIDGRMNGRLDTNSPCVLQDFVPFGSAVLLPLRFALMNTLTNLQMSRARVSLTTSCLWATSSPHFAYFSTSNFSPSSYLSPSSSSSSSSSSSCDT